MPLIYESSYTKRPLLAFNSYAETMAPFVTSRIYKVDYDRERLELEDGDFLDLDWVKKDSNKLMVLTHGFEGNTRDPYMEKSAGYFSQRGFDILLWNLRSCSNEINRLPRFYHHGDSEDLRQVINHAKRTYDYQEVVLIGFSLGGLITMGYLTSEDFSDDVKCAVAFSTPLDVAAFSKRIDDFWARQMIRKNFNKLKRKVIKKAMQYPDLIDKEIVRKCNSLNELNREVLLQLNGFSSEVAFFEKNNGINCLINIKTPLLIVNAENDPLLSDTDFPQIICEKSDHVYLEKPKYGGHVGFSKKLDKEEWYLRRIAAFVGDFQ